MKLLSRLLTTSLMMVMSLFVQLAAGQADQNAKPVPPDEKKDDKWRFNVGIVHQWGARMRFNGPPAELVREVWTSLPGRNGRTTLDQTAGIRPSGASLTVPTDNITQYRDRTFDDGFVKVDTWTLDPLVPAVRYGTTWNWSYQNLSQYDPADISLAFHRTRSYSGSGLYYDSLYYSQDSSTREVLRDRNVSGSEKLCQNGLQFTALRRLKHWTRWDLDLDLDLAWFPKNSTEATDTPFEMLVHQDTYRVSERQTSAYSYETTIRETYIYGDRFGRLDLTIPRIPVSAPPPYAGGGMNGPGPLLPELPEHYNVNVITFNSLETPLASDRSASLVGSRSWNVADHVGMDVDLQRLRFAGGLSLTRPLTKRLEVALNPKLTLNFVDADITRTETVVVTDLSDGSSTVLATRQTRNEKSVWVPGLLLALDLNYHLTERWFVGAYGSYEWLLNTLDLDVGADHVNIKLDGIEVSLYLGRHF